MWLSWLSDSVCCEYLCNNKYPFTHFNFDAIFVERDTETRRRNRDKKKCIKNHVAVSENGPQTRILYHRTQKFSLFIYTFAGLALECYECAEASGMDLPGFNKKCDSNNIAKITCPDIYYYDRCITVKMKMSFAHMPPVTMEMRNCSSSVSCDPQSKLNGKCTDMPLDS